MKVHKMYNHETSANIIKTILVNVNKKIRDKLIGINNILSENYCVHHGFLGGTLGLIYYYYNAFLILKDKKLAIRAKDLLNQVLADVNEENNQKMAGAFLCNGATGLAYILNYLSNYKLINFDSSEELKEIDDFIFSAALQSIEEDKIDFLHGALGVIYYLASKPQDKNTSHYINTLSEAFFSKSVNMPTGLYYKNLSLLRNTPNTADLGLAHGLSGMLLILLNVWPLLKNKKKAEEIITCGIKYILNNRREPNVVKAEHSLFPAHIDKVENGPFYNNRLAWCYGDLNHTLLLCRAGKLFKNASYTTAAEKIGKQTIYRKTYEETLSSDTQFCHGSAGLAQFYKILYYETGNDIYLSSYNYWIDVTVNIVEQDMKPNENINHTGLLEGLAGTALVLTDYFSTGKPGWSKVFLL